MHRYLVYLFALTVCAELTMVAATHAKMDLDANLSVFQIVMTSFVLCLMGATAHVSQVQDVIPVHLTKMR
jgi:hypothetical protein